MNFMNIMVIIFCIIAAGAGFIGYVSDYMGSGKNIKEDEEKKNFGDKNKVNK